MTTAPASGDGGRGGRVRLVATTAIVTSLAWIAGLALWMEGGRSRADLPPPVSPAAIAAIPAAVSPSPGLATQGLIVPVAGIGRVALVDTFDQSRANGGRTHDAIDIMAPRGAPVIAAAPGTVEKLFLSKEGGNTIYVRSPDGRLLYYYAHLDSYAPGLAEGQQVAAGAPLGTVGSTGDASPEAPHLHFAMAEADPAAPWYQNAPALNPYPWLVSGQRPELGALTQRSAPSDPSASTRRRNDRPDSLYTSPRSGPEVNSTRSPVIR